MHQQCVRYLQIVTPKPENAAETFFYNSAQDVPKQGATSAKGTRSAYNAV